MCISVASVWENGVYGAFPPPVGEVVSIKYIYFIQYTRMYEGQLISKP